MVNLILSKLHHLELGTDDSIIEESEFNLAAYSDASQILEFIEQIGMLPPENGKEASYIVDYRFNCLKWDEE